MRPTPRGVCHTVWPLALLSTGRTALSAPPSAAWAELGVTLAKRGFLPDLAGVLGVSPSPLGVSQSVRPLALRLASPPLVSTSRDDILMPFSMVADPFTSQPPLVSTHGMRVDEPGVHWSCRPQHSTSRSASPPSTPEASGSRRRLRDAQGVRPTPLGVCQTVWPRSRRRMLTAPFSPEPATPSLSPGRANARFSRGISEL